jgi:outer membrane lipoprotein
MVFGEVFTHQEMESLMTWANQRGEKRFGTGCEMFWAMAGLALWVTGCSTPYQSSLPSDLSRQVEPSLTFSQIKDDPDAHKGKLVILGGQVLKATRLQDSTQLVILQLPLQDDEKPTMELTRSEGRFIAFQQAFLDPATVPSGTRLTLVGEITGSMTQSLDETTYTYPTLTIKHFKVWPAYTTSGDFYRYPPYYATPSVHPYLYAYPYAGRRGRFFGYYPYWYWW